MNKSICTVMSVAIALAAGVVFADTAYQYGDWFKGIGTSPTSLSALGESGGSWSNLDGDGVSFASSKIVLEDVETPINFAISATEPDTEVLDRVELALSGSAGAYSSLPTYSELTTAGSQLAFALAKADSVLGYYAWVGGDAWQKLVGATPTEEADFTLTVEIDYSVANEPRVRFSVGSTVLTLGGSTWTTITATAAQSVRKISGVKFGGNGKLAKVDGSVRLGVASVNGVKYGTIADAVDAANQGSVKTVEVLRKTDESVSLENKSGITIADNGNMSGTITVPSDQEIKLAPKEGEFTSGTVVGGSGDFTLNAKYSGGTVSDSSITLPNEISPYKEVVPGSVTKGSDGKVSVSLRTKDSIVAAVSVGGKSLTVTSGLRTFLSGNVSAYTAPGTTTSSLQTALTNNGSNKLPVWQSYVLGLDPTDSTSVPKIAPLAASDTSTDALKIQFPKVDPPSDSGYTVKYRLYDNGTQVGADQTSPSSIELPLDSSVHAYTIKPVIISE